MADFTASTGIRDIIATHLASCYYWITLHDDTGGLVAADTYSAGVRGELATEFGYTRGTKTLSLSNTAGVLDGADAVWTADSGSIGPASYSAVWASATNSITGAVLISVDDKSADPQTATTGQTMISGVANPITIPTPS